MFFFFSFFCLGFYLSYGLLFTILNLAMVAPHLCAGVMKTGVMQRNVC